MSSYNDIRLRYKPQNISILLVAESPPPAPAIQSSRHFYRTDKIRKDDRLFVNTIKALYSEAAGMTESEIEARKDSWLRRFQEDGWYMIEALETSLKHEVTKQQRQKLIQGHLPNLIERVRGLAGPRTKIILIKSNVFEVAAAPLRAAGFTVLNKELVDYPGHYNQQDYRRKLNMLV